MDMVMTKGFKYFKSKEGQDTFTIVVKPWTEYEVSIDFYYNERFIAYIHTKADLDDILNIGDCTDYVLDLMKGTEKLMTLTAIVQDMIFIEEWLEFEYHPEGADYTIKVCAKVIGDGNATFEVHIIPYPLDTSSRNSSARKFHQKVNSIDEIQSWGEKFNSVRIML